MRHREKTKAFSQA